MLTLLLLASLVSGPFLLATYDINQDGKADKVYWTSAPAPVVRADELGLPPLANISVLVRSNDSLREVGHIGDISEFRTFWVRNSETKSRRLFFRFLQHGNERYFGISRTLKMFEVPAETFS